MGGLYGHLNHIYDDVDLTFAEVKHIFNSITNGNIKVTEKMDGQAISATWKGKTIFARNKGHMKNLAQNGLDVHEFIKSFEGRGDLSDAFGQSAIAIDLAIQALDEELRETMFMEGSKFINFEIIYPETKNVISYDKKMIVIHSQVSYSLAGEPIAENERMGGLLYKSMHTKNHNDFVFIGPNSPRCTQVIPVTSSLDEFMSIHNLEDEHTIEQYFLKRWEDVISKLEKNHHALDQNFKYGLFKRLAFDDKSLNLVNIKKNVSPEMFEDLSKLDLKKHRKEIGFDLETTIAKMGSHLLRSMDGYVAPKEAKEKISEELEHTLLTLAKMGIDDHSHELKKLEAIGKDLLHHAEGIVFAYNDKRFKITGTFAPVNQVLGTLKFRKDAITN
jgi:hypothetical protein